MIWSFRKGNPGTLLGRTQSYVSTKIFKQNCYRHKRMSCGQEVSKQLENKERKLDFRLVERKFWQPLISPRRGEKGRKAFSFLFPSPYLGKLA